MSSKPIIVIDPGHGGHDSGALSPTGLREADVVLDVAQRVREYIGEAMTVIMTRSTDRFLDLWERADIANVAGADYFLSIHCNSSTSDARGFEVFTSPGQTAADPFATDIFNAYALEFPELNARKDLGDGDPDKEAKFTVLTRTDCPAVLHELEFIHTPHGDAWLRCNENRERAAGAIAKACLRHAGITDPRATGDESGGPTMAPDIRRGAELIERGLRVIRQLQE